MKISCLKDFILEIPEAFNPNDFGYDREQGDILDNLGEGTTLESKTISENFLNLFCYLRRIRQEDAELIQVANKKHFEKIIIFIQEKVDSCERRISSELFEVLSQVVTDKMSEKLPKHLLIS